MRPLPRTYRPIAALTVVIFGGCNSASKRSLPASEPGLSASVTEPAVSVAEAPPVVRTTSIVDRHPLLSKPRQYYESTNNNKAVKTAAATVIGVPAGIFGELKQIVAGSPAPATKSY